MKKMERMVAMYLKERDWVKHGSPAKYAKSISIEAAELLELFQWSEPSAKKIKANPELLKKVKGELADVFLYGIELALILKLDTEKIIIEKLEHNKKKYPPELVRKGLANYYKIKQQYRAAKK